MQKFAYIIDILAWISMPAFNIQRFFSLAKL